MTPTGIPRRETGLAYSGGVIDRAANQRSDPGWIDAILAKAGTRLMAETVHVDGEEVIQARWFSRDELTEHAAAGGRLGREDSIDRYLLRSWLDEAS